MIILDDVISEIEFFIEQHPPERGGILFGPIGKELITHFVFDKEASTTYVTYTPSEQIRKRVPKIESETGLEYKGIIHSHPGSLDRLSYGDEIAAANALSSNLHLAKIFLPVISQPASRIPKSHEMNIGRSKLSGYAALRAADSSRTARIQKESVRSLGLKTDLKTALSEVAATMQLPIKLNQIGKPTVLDIQDCVGISYSIAINGLDIIIIANEGYPTFAPLLLYSRAGSNTISYPLSWRMEESAFQNLVLGFHSLLEHDKPINLDRLRDSILHNQAKNNTKSLPSDKFVHVSPEGMLILEDTPNLERDLAPITHDIVN